MHSESEIFEASLGIPNVHVVSVDKDEAGLRVVVQTRGDEAACPSCSQPVSAQASNGQ